MHKSLIKLFDVIKIVVLVSVITLVIVGSLSWVKMKQSFDDPNFIFSGNSIVDDSEYQTYLAKITATNLIDDDYAALADKIEEHPYVAGVRVSKHFPNQVLVEISERYPVALINSSPLLLIDNKSTVLPFRSNSFDFRIPIISNFEIDKNSMPLGERTTAHTILEATEFLNRLKIEYPELYDNLSEFRLNNYNEYELILENEPTKIVIGDAISWSKILVLKEFEKNIAGQKVLTDYVYLDLRYNNQVITKERHA